MAIDWELIDENSNAEPVGAQTFILYTCPVPSL